MAVSVTAQDRTPYNFGSGGNSYSGTTNYTPTVLAERLDLFIAYGDWDLLADSIMDTILSWPSEDQKPFRFGPYASTQELPLRTSGALWDDSSYAARIADSDPFWLVYYAYAYLDSIGVSRESLMVHLDEDSILITNVTTRGYDPNTLGAPHNRFSYQAWGNTSADTFMYPGGYQWLANQANTDAAMAIAYAFKRYMIEDSADYESGRYHYNCYFSDNQYRHLTAPRLPSYYTINYTFGGPTSVMDWVEVGQIENNYDSLRHYYDNSVLRGDSIIDSIIYAACDSAGFTDSIIRFSNVDKYNNTHLSVQIKYTSVSFENVFNWNGSGWAVWRNLIRNADTIQGRNDDTGPDRRFALWNCRLNTSIGSEGWNTADRIYYGVYAWFLTFQEDNMYLNPAQFNDTTRWVKIFETGIGDRIDATFDTTNPTGTGDYGTKTFVMQCKYINGLDSAITLYRTGYGGETGQTTDSVSVSLGNNYYKIDVNGDTAETSVSSAYIHPCEGWIGTQVAPGSGPSAPTGLEIKGGIRIKGDVKL
jgi:hypothetical protein